MVLTDKQRHELHVAILDYLSSESHGGGFATAAEAFMRESGLSEGVSEGVSGKASGLLEKKWTSVIRLQKKVSECLCVHCVGVGVGMGMYVYVCTCL